MRVGRISEDMTSSRMPTKNASSQPAKMPGASMGRVTRVNVCQDVAPATAEASDSVGDMAAAEVLMFCTAMGTNSTVNAITRINCEP